jgi:hypothetical protein
MQPRDGLRSARTDDLTAQLDGLADERQFFAVKRSPGSRTIAELRLLGESWVGLKLSPSR